MYMPLFHVKQAFCVDIAPVEAVARNCGQEYLSAGSVQFREASDPAGRIEFRCQIINQHYRRKSEYRGKISDLCNRNRGDEQFCLAARQAMLQRPTAHGETQVGPMWSSLRVAAQAIARK